MEVWNREELYNEVWEQPLVKLAVKHGVSAVMIGKVCRKLQIPLPGRGYWVKKEFGKPVERLPLPDVKNLPVVQRLKEMKPPDPEQKPDPPPQPTDAEWLRTIDIESRTIRIDPLAKEHRLIVLTRRHLKNARTDNRGMLLRPYNEPCLDIRVSPVALPRALSIMNAVIHTLETEGFPVSIDKGKHGTSAEIFGQQAGFCLAEKLRQKSRREIKTANWTMTEVEYAPKGLLEFRTGESYFSTRLRDGKLKRLEDLLPRCVGLVVREGRALKIRAEEARVAAIEREKKRQERAKLADEIHKEEKKLSDLNGWIDAWTRAAQMRGFIAALESAWKEEGHDLSPEAPKGQRILWMKQQADRIDPMVESPASILDRKHELTN